MFRKTCRAFKQLSTNFLYSTNLNVFTVLKKNLLLVLFLNLYYIIYHKDNGESRIASLQNTL